ncbi:MAG: hypothetical protein JW747_06585 [Candidatus Aminicenantes bacterium]|nr:hypothetical protein [Candidatus Aminicenantes bacterium]
MRKSAPAFFVLALSAAMILPLRGSQEAVAESVGKAELQKMYMDYLTEEGYKPEIDEDGDVRFKREGRNYFIQVDDKDLEFFRLVFPNFWPIESEEERTQVLAAADVSNAKSKVAKVYTVRDNIWASIEIFVAKPEHFKDVFKRSISALENGVANFVNKMRE